MTSAVPDEPVRITFLVTADEKRRIREAAAIEERDMAGFIRIRVVPAADDVLKKAKGD